MQAGWMISQNKTLPLFTTAPASIGHVIKQPNPYINSNNGTFSVIFAVSLRISPMEAPIGSLDTCGP